MSQPRPTPSERDGGPSPSRRLAGLVLIPAVPLLGLSILALAAFYTAPERFGVWLARLPGDTYLRTALIFAPASLLAVVLLATLYLRESSGDEAAGAQVGTGLARAARLSLAVSGPLLLLVGVVRAAAFLDAERVAGWLEAMPATGYLTRALELGPLILGLAVGVGILVGVASREGTPLPAEARHGRAPRSRARLGRLASELVLVLATPALALSLVGLGLQIFMPGRLARWLEPLPGDAYIRLLLTLAPAGLLAVLLIAVLYLLGPLDPGRTQPVPRLEGRRLRLPEAWRSDAAMVVLLTGLVVAVAAGALLVGGVLVLLLVR
jgi:hypothetical protein